MALFSIPDIKLSGVAACVPERVFDNRDYGWNADSERDSFIKTVGVEKRHVVKKGTATSDLCLAAAFPLMKELQWDPAEIDVLIFVSQSRDYLIPATACILQERLGLSKSCLAFDISMGCSGYIYGLSVIASMMTGGRLRKGLLLVGDVSTRNTSEKDKSAFPLFGDGGTATALEFSKDAPELAFNLQTDGKGYEAIIIPDGGIRNFVNEETSFKYETFGEGISRNRLHIALNGVDVFNFSLREVPPNIRALMEFAGTSIENIDQFVFHQANKLMNESVRRKSKIPAEKYPYSIGQYGNTSSASIPLTMVTQLRDELAGNKRKLLLCGFGVGLSWGSVILESDHIICPDLVEYKD